MADLIEINADEIGAVDTNTLLQEMEAIVEAKGLISQPDKKKALLLIPQKQEGKTRRVQLAMRPSTVNALQENAKELGISLNELFCLLAEQYLKQLTQ